MYRMAVAETDSPSQIPDPVNTQHVVHLWTNIFFPAGVTQSATSRRFSRDLDQRSVFKSSCDRTISACVDNILIIFIYSFIFKVNCAHSLNTCCCCCCVFHFHICVLPTRTLCAVKHRLPAGGTWFVCLKWDV